MHLVNEVAREQILARVLRGVRNDYDVILIDGRFRVASAAASMLRAPAARILFDDYTDRPFYWAVDAIGDRVAQAGRMVEFGRKASTTDGDLHLVVEAYAADWR